MKNVEADDFVGMIEGEAIAKAEGAGCITRITSRDGAYLPAIRDYRAYDRINFNIENGVVVAARFN